ncbi:MAG: hypothetical protein J6S04_06390 [Clostridia bacterium]|nr:hypothetical protein [Clostridia bacterium]
MANYYMYNPEKPGVVYPMKADKKKAMRDGFTGSGASKKTCPKCARKMSARKQICKCGYMKPAAPSQAKYRWLALFVAIFAALAIAVIPYTMIASKTFDAELGSWVIASEKTSLLTMITSGMTEKIFGSLPAFEVANGGESGLVYSSMTYVFLVFAVLAALQAVFAILSYDKAAKRVRRAFFILAIGAFAYTIGFALCLNTIGTDVEPVVAFTEGVLALGAYSLEMFTAVIAVVSMVGAIIVRACSNRIIKLEKKIKKAEAKINKAKGL